MSDDSWVQQIRHETAGIEQSTAIEKAQPFVVYGARVFRDGSQWCALLGEDIATGVCGFGDSPAQAAAAFDVAWHERLPAPGAAP